MSIRTADNCTPTAPTMLDRSASPYKNRKSTLPDDSHSIASEIVEVVDTPLINSSDDEEFLSPHAFASKKLGIDCWPKMREIFDAVERGERKILVRSCNGAGKTTALAALCNWKLSQFPESIVLTTASSWTQVTRSLWGEIRRQARFASLYDQSDIASTHIKLDDKHYAIGISPSMPENAQGFHAPNMLIAVDEATGVQREIIDALWGNATGSDAQMIMIYNPIDETSYPFTAEETGKWHVITISAFEHPNVIEGREIIPGAVTREWIEDRLQAWSYEVNREEVKSSTNHDGSITATPEPTLPDPMKRPKGFEHPMYDKMQWMVELGLAVWKVGYEPEEAPKNPSMPEPLNNFQALDTHASFSTQDSSLVYVPWRDTWWKKTELVATRICGEWPMDGGESYIERGLILRTFDVAEERGARALGVDVARSGNDRTVFAFFDGNTQLPFECSFGKDLMATANRIVELYKQGWTTIAVDDTGIGGGVTDRLRELKIPHVPVNFSSKPKRFIRYKEIANARAEMYFLLEEEIRAGKLKLIDDKEMIQELSAFRIVVDQSTAYRIEDKAIIKQRLGRSPDKSDAVALARYGIRLSKLAAMPKLL